MDAEAASVSARFFGLAPESAAPRTTAFVEEIESIVAIHFGISGVSPPLGRFFHCLAAITRNRTPIAAMTQLTPTAISLSGSLAPPATSTTRTLTTVSPATHPTANAGPFARAFGLSSTRTTATIGMG